MTPLLKYCLSGSITSICRRAYFVGTSKLYSHSFLYLPFAEVSQLRYSRKPDENPISFSIFDISSKLSRTIELTNCLINFILQKVKTEGKTKASLLQQKTIFVDCFNTIILRNEKKNRVFKNWAKALEVEYQIKWQKFYWSYKRINFWLCLKKIFKKFILQENFDLVLKKMHKKLFNKRTEEVENFITIAKYLYLKEEQTIHFVNNNFIDFLREQKKLGKKIYIVSDFYCSANEIKILIRNLNIDDIFEDIFSSSDFGKEKSTRGLYKVLLKNLHLVPKDTIMFGDNLWSDYLMAKSCGLSAKIFNNKKELKNEN